MRSILNLSIITANWLAERKRDVWTLPVGGGVGKIVKLGKLPLNISVDAYTNIKQPHVVGPDWTLRTQIQFLFPKQKNILNSGNK